MSYTELEHGYQGLRQATQPQFYVGDDGNLVPIRSSVSLHFHVDIVVVNYVDTSEQWYENNNTFCIGIKL